MKIVSPEDRVVLSRQPARDQRPATSRQKLDQLKQHLIQVHDGSDLPTEDELTASMRAED